ncbi:MAG: hypothetical protein PHI42_06270 [Paludibacteraceae bacterium]|nr:hypothetical protein [Paludibacteraceae bacterium]
MIKLLDLYCKAGGCSMGYYLAAKELGLEIQITGVDIEPQPNYPFMFIQADAVEFFKESAWNYTHVHASPPCQKYTPSTSLFRGKGKIYRDSLLEIKQAMLLTSIPGIIENVPSAPITPNLVLRGDMFGLKVLRTRVFETINYTATIIPQLPKKVGTVRNGDYAQVCGHGSKKGMSKHDKPFKHPGTVLE